MKRKPKYKIGDIIYCRPWMRNNRSGMSVLKCRVIEVGNCGGSPYYDLETIDKQRKAFVIYEEELSKRPERLVKEARKEIEDYYSSYIERYNHYINKLKEVC